MQLYKKPNSPNWYARGQDGKGFWKNASTGTADKDEALQIMGQWEVDGFFPAASRGRPSATVSAPIINKDADTVEPEDSSMGGPASVPRLSLVSPIGNEGPDPDNQSINQSLGIAPPKPQPKAEPPEVTEIKEKTRKKNESLCELLGQIAAPALIGAAAWGYRQLDIEPAKPNAKHLKEFGDALSDQLKEWISDREVKPWVKACLLFSVMVFSMGLQGRRIEKPPKGPTVKFDPDAEIKEKSE